MSLLCCTTHIIIKLSLICTCETSCAQNDKGTLNNSHYLDF